MKLLEDRILKDGTVLPGNVLKVDCFLNHQIDVRLIKELGKALYEEFRNYEITKILTVEASGIVIACAAADHFDVPVVFAKKGHHKNVGTDVYAADVHSFTKGITNTVCVSKKFINADDKVLIIDDFLADGQACLGLKSICEQAGAAVVGFGIAIEKGFQNGGKLLRQTGLPVVSLAIVASMTDDSICFASND